MEITKGSDLILVLKLTDFKDEVMRVKDCADFRLYVWTANRNNFLQFTKSDIKQEENVDKIAIPDFMVNCLESGVICYQYQYSKYDNNFEISDNYYDKSKIVVTDLYFRNTNFNEEPANPVNYQTLNYLTNKIEKIAIDCENNHAQVKEWLDTEYMDKLNAEIKRSNEVDIEFHKLIKSNKEDADNKATELNNKLDAEIERSNNVDTELNNVIQTNKADCDSKNTATNEKVDAEIARSSQKDADLENAIDTEVTRATNAETVIDTKLEGEIERAKTAEGAIRDAVENERDRAIAKETLINDSLTSEIARAKQVETDITTNLQALKTAVETEKQRSADKDTEHTNSLNQLSAKLDTEISRATDREQHINDDLHSEIDRAKAAEKDTNDALTSEITRSTDKDAELAASIADNSTAISNEVTRATIAEKTLTDALNAEIKRSSDKDTELTNALTVEVNRAKAEEARIEAESDTNSSKIDAEVERAKLVEKDITEKLQSLKSSVADKNTSTDDAINQLQAGLNLEIDRAKASEKANADAIAVINGDSSTIGSIAHSLADAKHYTDDEVAKAKQYADTQLQLTIDSYATKKHVDDRIKAVIGTAPEALDTLGEIATVLNGNGDAITAINGVLTGKANSSDVYIKSEVDDKVKDVNDKVVSEINRAKTKEADINAALQSEISRSTAAENKLTSDLQTEIDRAKAAEKANADAIAVFGGGEEVIGSLAHGVADAKHYTDDEIAKIQANQNVALSNMATKNEVAEVDGKLTAHIAASDTKFGDIYTKSEVDTLIDNVDVTERLANYYTKSETYNKTEIDTALTAYPKKTEITAITDENGNIITEMVIDNSSADDSVEVYTKEQCDERFAKVWQGTQAEFNALTTKDSSTIYIIK